MWDCGSSLRSLTRTFLNFKDAVKDYDSFDANVKRAVLKASPSVASILTRTGTEVLFIGSGTIIEHDEENRSTTILTSATLLRGPTGASSIPSDLRIEVYLSDGKLYEGQVLACDFHYNIATIIIKSTSPLPIACIRYVDDSLEIVLRRPTIGRHSNRFKLRPGEHVVALGRDFEDDREVMASPGVFSALDSGHDCNEIFMTSCIVTKLAVGGPLINCHGEVIGVNFFICPYNAFIPINIVSKCLEGLKRNGKVARPWLGARIANLYSADLEMLDNLHQKFPNVSSGVMVEQVVGKRNVGSRNSRTKARRWTLLSPRNWLKAKALRQNDRNRKEMKLISTRLDKSYINKSRMRKWQESPAVAAGLCTGDVVVKCGEVPVCSHLEFVEALWDKEEKPLELVLMRPSIGQQTVTLTVGTCPEMPRWDI